MLPLGRVCKQPLRSLTRICQNSKLWVLPAIYFNHLRIVMKAEPAVVLYREESLAGGHTSTNHTRTQGHSRKHNVNVAAHQFERIFAY